MFLVMRHCILSFSGVYIYISTILSLALSLLSGADTGLYSRVGGSVSRFTKLSRACCLWDKYFQLASDFIVHTHSMNDYSINEQLYEPTTSTPCT